MMRAKTGRGREEGGGRGGCQRRAAGWYDVPESTSRLTLLGSAVEGAILRDAEVDLNELSAGEKLDDHAGGNDGGDSEFHEGSPGCASEQAVSARRDRTDG
jgi:hypothetical protein